MKLNIKLMLAGLLMMVVLSVSAQNTDCPPGHISVNKGNGNWKCEPESPLPVELLYFKARQHYNSIVVYWSTASEFNSAYYIVEGSEDGKTFVELSKVEAQGNSSKQSYYQIGLKHYPYYRLVQMDLDNSKTYYHMIFSNYKEVASFKGINYDTIGRRVN